MTVSELTTLAEDIVQRACELKDLHTTALNAPVNYACIFSHTETEYAGYIEAIQTISVASKETPSGTLFTIRPIDTVAGPLQLLKIRRPDPDHPELGDADFTVPMYKEFKKEYLHAAGFKLIVRSDMEMLELIDPAFPVRAYFSYPPLDQQMGLIAGERSDEISA